MRQAGDEGTEAWLNESSRTRYGMGEHQMMTSSTARGRTLERLRRRLISATVVGAMAAAAVLTGPAFAGKPTNDPPPPESTATFKSVETAGGYLASGASLDLAVPDGVVAGDFLVAQVAYNANGDIAEPDGWNVIDVVSHPTRPIMQGLYWRAVTDHEPGYFSFALTSGKSDTAAGAIAAYSGIDLMDPIDAVGGQTSGGSNEVVAPSITTTVADATVIGFFTARDDGSFTPPENTIERWDVSSAAGVGAIGETIAAGTDEIVATAGSTGTRTAVASASDGGIGHLLALKPATTSSGGDDTYVQWEDASALVGLPPGQYSGSMEWITNQITGANRFWNAGYDGSGVDVALIDTGVVPVDGLSWPGKIINGPDLSFESQADNLRHLDAYGHGTHLAGIIAGRDDADSQFSGMAPGARIVNLKVADSSGAVDVSQVIAAIDWTVQHRHDNDMDIRVITLAYGTDSTQPYQVDPLSDAVERAWEAGIVVVVAAGNDGNSAPLRNPAVDPFVIAVGAAENDSSQISGIASFSNCGTSNRFVDVVAPGRSILSLRSPGSYADQQYPQAATPGGYFLGSGTSQAAAVVAGGVALLLDQRPELNPDQVKGLLMDNADNIQGADFTCQGAGSLNLQAIEKAHTPKASSVDQTFEVSDGTGSLEAARGTNHVYDKGIALEGDFDIMSSPWTGYCTSDGATCVETLWDGGNFNGASWSGASWSGASWSGASWSGASWSGASWSGASWSSKSWSGASWSGASWSSAFSSESNWSGSSWS
jgi:serine protease AprX